MENLWRKGDLPLHYRMKILRCISDPCPFGKQIKTCSGPYEDCWRALGIKIPPLTPMSVRSNKDVIECHQHHKEDAEFHKEQEMIYYRELKRREAIAKQRELVANENIQSWFENLENKK